MLALYLAEAKQESQLDGTQHSDRACGVCWTPVGRRLSDAHSDIFPLQPPLWRPGGQFCSCNFPSHTPSAVQTVPALQKVKSLHQQCSRSHWTSASGLPSFSAAPTRPARPAGVQGRREVIIGKAGVPPFPTNQGNTFTRLSSSEQQK